MHKKVYLIDISKLTEYNLSVEEFLLLISIQDIDIEIEIQDKLLKSLEQKEYIKIIFEENEEIPVIKKKGKLLIDSLKTVNLDSVTTTKAIRKIAKQIDPEINQFVTEFRHLWKGLKPGSMGSQNGCKEKLIRWMKDNPTQTKEGILKAAKTYLKSLNDYRYLQAADYFVYKRDIHGESSRLSAFIDEAELPSDEWSSNLN